MRNSGRTPAASSPPSMQTLSAVCIAVQFRAYIKPLVRSVHCNSPPQQARDPLHTLNLLILPGTFERSSTPFPFSIASRSLRLLCRKAFQEHLAEANMKIALLANRHEARSTSFWRPPTSSSDLATMSSSSPARPSATPSPSSGKSRMIKSSHHAFTSPTLGPQRHSKICTSKP